MDTCASSAGVKDILFDFGCGGKLLVVWGFITGGGAGAGGRAGGRRESRVMRL